MDHKIYIPKPNRMSNSCKLVEWRKEEGNSIQAGEIILLFESQKSSMYLESPVNGILKKRFVPSGTWINVSNPVGIIEI
jgi:pyruvate/2-oxoglutarate dehydrogenase complex dihydrolipoamide acyltransferase (E2) component